MDIVLGAALTKGLPFALAPQVVCWGERVDLAHKGVRVFEVRLHGRSWSGQPADGTVYVTVGKPMLARRMASAEIGAPIWSWRHVAI